MSYNKTVRLNENYNWQWAPSQPPLTTFFLIAGEKSVSQQKECTVAEHPTLDVEQQIRTKQQPRYHVILWNDDDHSYEYVIKMLKSLFRHPVERGYELASRVDQDGRAVCLTTTMEHAELKRDQIHAFGGDKLIQQCKGSMSASIEPEC
jgi:ATP-dependent Clp protease adaptor protein ClpS